MRSSFGEKGKCGGSNLATGTQPGNQGSLTNFRAQQRHISPASGRALETLGHAIEYLADEYALRAAEIGRLDSGDPRIEAIQLLMSLNRQVYYSCPEIEPLLRRFSGWLFGVPAPGRTKESTFPQ